MTDAHPDRSVQQNVSKATPATRGRPFQPGNPGRPPGAKNRTTRLVEQLVGDEAERLTRKLIELALAGDVRCLQYCLDRLMPQRSGRPVDLQLPAIENVNDVAPALAAVATAVNDGILTAEDAAHLVCLIERYAKAYETHNLAARLDALESQMKETKR
jgi:hypothetical protein